MSFGLLRIVKVANKGISNGFNQTQLFCPKSRMINTTTNAFFKSFSTTSTQRKVIKLDRDNYSNIPESIESRLGTDLHLKSAHPLNTIKRLIEGYFANKYNSDTKFSLNSDKSKVKKFRAFDDLSPVVTTNANFDELLIPTDHDSRKPNNTYYITKDSVLRCHTSAHQNHLMKSGELAFLASGDVYRRDEIDATHYPIFHQMEGVRVFTEEELGTTDEAKKTELVLEDLKIALEGMVRELFGKIEVRWVDAFFPFTNPSLEMEIFYNNQWLEVLGCGVIQQQILRNCQLSTNRGWAFGLGLERLAMILFNIPDIRLFWSSDPRFHSQFSDGKITKFQPYSKYPVCLKDITFWLPKETEKFHENDFFELVRSVAGDLVETVKLVDSFKHPKTGRTSHCYRINFRSMDRNLTNDEINKLQDQIRFYIPKNLGAELR